MAHFRSIPFVQRRATEHSYKNQKQSKPVKGDQEQTCHYEGDYLPVLPRRPHLASFALQQALHFGFSQPSDIEDRKWSLDDFEVVTSPADINTTP